MTEKEKSKRGLLYNANFDEELIKERALSARIYGTVANKMAVNDCRV